MDDDSQQLRAAAAGEVAAFGRFAHRHTAAVLRYCLLRVGDRHAAEDATQEALLRLYQQVGRRQVPAEPLPWLLAIARRCCQEAGRKLKRHCAVPLNAEASPAAEPTGDPLSEVHEAMGTLNDFETALLHLKHTEGLRCQEIGRRLGKPLGTVTAALSRAYAKLRAKLREEPGT
jgi:RNA polymerase sigma-70 factor (ECF subfamily)